MSEEKKKCPVCAEMIAADAAVCEFCGAKLSASGTQPGESARKLELYNPNAAALWSLLLTPIFGAYVVKSNWQTLGQEQQEKRSQNWLLALVVLVALAVLALALGLVGSGIAGLNLVALLIWYFLECKPQQKYMADNKLDYQKKVWKPLVPKAAGIWVGAAVLLCVIRLLVGGEPTLDCSSVQDFEETAKEIVEYVQKDIGAEELERKIENGDSLTKSEEKELVRFEKLRQFFAGVRLTERFPPEIDGMSASDLLDYVDKL